MTLQEKKGEKNTAALKYIPKCLGYIMISFCSIFKRARVSRNKQKTEPAADNNRVTLLLGNTNVLGKFHLKHTFAFFFLCVLTNEIEVLLTNDSRVD